MFKTNKKILLSVVTREDVLDNRGHGDYAVEIRKTCTSFL